MIPIIKTRNCKVKCRNQIRSIYVNYIFSCYFSYCNPINLCQNLIQKTFKRNPIKNTWNLQTKSRVHCLWCKTSTTWQRDWKTLEIGCSDFNSTRKYLADFRNLSYIVYSFIWYINTICWKTRLTLCFGYKIEYWYIFRITIHKKT